MTNFEKIKAMTAEEIALLVGTEAACKSVPTEVCRKINCADCWLSWIDNEATND